MNSAPEVARDYATRMRRRFGERLELLQIFGSYARGEAHEESDLDVLVVVRDLLRSEKLCALDEAAEAALGKGLALNALVMSAAEHQRLLALESRLVLDICGGRREPVTLENRKVHVSAELRRGQAALRAARELWKLGLYHDAVSRAY